MKGATNQAGSPSPEADPPRRPPLRWRWYHFYFLLALFDLVIIGISLYLYHQTVRSYSVALTNLRNIDDAKEWVSSLRQAIVQLNAPGNDVFESRNVRLERGRFTRTQVRYEALLRRASEFGMDVGAFHDHVEGMVRAEQRIFSIFEELEAGAWAGDEERHRLAAATSIMASMDRNQADALETLGALAHSLSSQAHHLLDRYGILLERSAEAEKYLLGTVALILVGVFWYGRKLQSTHEAMIAEQQQAIEEKHARLAAVGEVCSSVSHGIKNPLAAITSSAQLALHYGTLDESTRLRIQDVLNESRRLNERVSRLLSFASAQREEFRPCDLTQVVRDAIHEIRPKLDERGVRVTTECADGPVMIHGDREWLASAIIEVVSNSMDHLPSGGNVTVRCQRDAGRNGTACIDIIDDGPGIPERVRPHVFELFYTSKAEGNGIGLASVKRVMDMHGGRVAVGDQDVGTRIEMRLPTASSTRL